MKSFRKDDGASAWRVVAPGIIVKREPASRRRKRRPAVVITSFHSPFEDAGTEAVLQLHTKS